MEKHGHTGFRESRGDDDSEKTTRGKGSVGDDEQGKDEIV